MTMPQIIESIVEREDWDKGLEASLPFVELEAYADCCVLAFALKRLGFRAGVHNDGCIFLFDASGAGLGEEYAADLAGQALINDFDNLLQDKLETEPTFPIKVVLTRV